MWESLESHLETLGVKDVDRKQSIYVGDAAGRPFGHRSWIGGNEKDFSDSDRKFALNAGLMFNTPEEFFLGKSEEKFMFLGFDACAWQDSFVSQAGKVVGHEIGDGLEMVLMVGLPGSGKTTFAKNNFESKGILSL